MDGALLGDALEARAPKRERHLGGVLGQRGDGVEQYTTQIAWSEGGGGEDGRIWKERGNSSDCSSTREVNSGLRTMRRTAEFHFFVLASVPGRKSEADTNWTMSLADG